MKFLLHSSYRRWASGLLLLLAMGTCTWVFAQEGAAMSGEQQSSFPRVGNDRAGQSGSSAPSVPDPPPVTEEVGKTQWWLGLMAGSLGVGLIGLGWQYRRLHRAFRTMSRRFGSMQSVGKISGWEYDLATKQMWWSREMYEIYGLPEETSAPLKLTVFLDRIHEDDRKGVEQTLNQMVTLQQERSQSYRILLADGSIRYLEGRGQYQPPSGRYPKGLVFGITRDVTEREEAYQARKEAQAFVELLVDIGKNFISSTVSELEANLQPALEAFIHSLNIDHAYWLTLTPEPMLRPVYEAHREGVEGDVNLHRLIEPEEMEWLIPRLEAGEGITWLTKSGNPQGPAGSLLTRHGIDALVMCPLAVEDELVGCLTFGWKTLPEMEYNRLSKRLKEITRFFGFLLQRKRAEVRSKTALIAGQERERKRLAEDIHDGLSPMLSALRLKLDAFAGGGTPDIDRFLAEVQAIVAATHQEVRAISHNLASSQLHRRGLEAGLRELVELLSTERLHISCHVILGECPLSEMATIGIYRMAQELLTNVVRHAEANEASLQLLDHGDHLVLMVSDNGKGLSLETLQHSAGIGWLNLTERLSALNGRYDLDSRPGRGTTFTLEIPR